MTSSELNRWFSEEHQTRYRLVINKLAATALSFQSSPGIGHPNSAGQAVPNDINTDRATIGEEDGTIEIAHKVGSTGRPATRVDYEIAVQAWWDLADDMVPRRPTQQDVCDRLAEMGIHIAVRTFRQKVFNWRREGHRWPGPRPGSEAA